MTDPFAPAAANDNRTRRSKSAHIYFDLLDARTQLLRRNSSQMTSAEIYEWQAALAVIGRMIRDVEPPYE